MNSISNKSENQICYASSSEFVSFIYSSAVVLVVAVSALALLATNVD